MEPETLLHMFIKCEHVQNLWIKLEKYMERFDTSLINFSEDKVMFNMIMPARANHIKNFCCLVTKYYIYKQRCLKLKTNFKELITFIESFECLEKTYAITKNRLHYHFKKWHLKSQDNDSNDFVRQYPELMPESST